MPHKPQVRRRYEAGDDDPESVNLARERRLNDLHLKGTLEAIYEKYSKDFSEIGDEVDILTGEVIINRGHVERMHNELDLGIGRPLRPQSSWLCASLRSNLAVGVGGEDGKDEIEVDEDEDDFDFCPRPQNVKATKVEDICQDARHSIEDDTSSTPNLSQTVKDTTPASSPKLVTLLPAQASDPSSTAPPQLDVVLESFKASITTQWRTFVDSYFPNQISASACQDQIQPVTPLLPAPRTSPAQNSEAGTHITKRKYPANAGSTEQICQNSSESTGDVKRLRLRSPETTPSLWALPEDRARGQRMRRTPSGDSCMATFQHADSKSTSTPRRYFPKSISTTTALEYDSDEDELASGTTPLASARFVNPVNGTLLPSPMSSEARFEDKAVCSGDAGLPQGEVAETSPSYNNALDELPLEEDDVDLISSPGAVLNSALTSETKVGQIQRGLDSGLETSRRIISRPELQALRPTEVYQSEAASNSRPVTHVENASHSELTEKWKKSGGSPPQALRSTSSGPREYVAVTPSRIAPTISARRNASSGLARRKRKHRFLTVRKSPLVLRAQSFQASTQPNLVAPKVSENGLATREVAQSRRKGQRTAPKGSHASTIFLKSGIDSQSEIQKARNISLPQSTAVAQSLPELSTVESPPANHSVQTASNSTMPKRERTSVSVYVEIVNRRPLHHARSQPHVPD